MRRRHLTYKHIPIVAGLLFAGCLVGFASGRQLGYFRYSLTIHPVTRQITTAAGDIGAQAAVGGISHAPLQPLPVSHPVNYAPHSLPATHPPHHKHRGGDHADHEKGKHHQKAKDDGDPKGGIITAAIPASVEIVEIVDMTMR